MATLEVAIASEELARLAQDAAREGMSMNELARKRIFGNEASRVALPTQLSPPPGSENWTLQDALDYAGPQKTR